MADSDDNDDSTGSLDRDIEAIRRLARELSFSDDEEILEESLERASRLQQDLERESLNRSEGQPKGHMSKDDSNALLYVYDTPRTETRGGALEGMTFAIKDSIAVKDLQMTCALKDHTYVPSYDAVVVERLLDEGATIVGKSNMYALGIGKVSELGRVRNAIDEDRVPGGSSTGSGVAVANGLVDASIGTDAGGSARIPATFAGLVGMKPTPGVVPSFGSVSTMKTLGAKCPITKTVADAARVFEVIAGPDSRDPATLGRDVGPVTDGLEREQAFEIGLPDSLFDASDDDVLTVIRNLVDEVSDRTDCTFTEVSFDNNLAHLPPYLSGPELAWIMRQGGIHRGGTIAFDPVSHHFVQELSDRGFNDIISRKKLPHAYLDMETDGLLYSTAFRKLFDYRDSVASLFEEVDLLLTPTVPMLPPKVADDIDDEPSTNGNTRPFNLAGTPAVTVPAGRMDELPVGAQIVAPAYRDARAFRGARMIEGIADGPTVGS